MIGGSSSATPQAKYFNSIKSEYIVGVILPNSLIGVTANSFTGWLGIERITIPATVDTIFTNAFKDCSNLTSVTLERWEAPSTITGILQSSPFNGTHADLKIYVPSAEAQEAYKVADFWSDIADKILVSP
jgi:hypothetical protein